MGNEPAWEAPGNRNFYHSIQAYVPSPLSFRHAPGCNPIATAGAGFWRPVFARRLCEAAIGAQCLPEIAEWKYAVIPCYPVGFLQIQLARTILRNRRFRGQVTLPQVPLSVLVNTLIELQDW